MRAGKTGIHLTWREVDAVLGALMFCGAGPMDGHPETQQEEIGRLFRVIRDIPQRPDIEWPDDDDDNQEATDADAGPDRYS